MSLTTDARELAGKHCRECKNGEGKLTEAQAKQTLEKLEGWALANGEITRTVTFKNFYQTIGFVNAVAYIANGENHHPDLEVGYDKCKIRFSTHSVGGLSENDFICAAKVSALLEA